MKAKNDTAIVSVCSKPFLKDKRKKKDFADIFDTSTEIPEKSFRTLKNESKLFSKTVRRQRLLSPLSKRS